MLTVLFAESGDNFAHLVRFYAPNAPRLLDVTYGEGTLVKRSPIPVVGVDQDPESKAHVIADSTNLPFEDGSFEVAVFDPPYLYGSKNLHMGPVGKKTWSTVRATFDTPADLIVLALGVAEELYRVLVPGGVVIVKCMDSRFKGRLVRNHDIVTEAFEYNGFDLHDQNIYVRTSIGSFVNSKSAQAAHGYFLVFKRRA